MKLLMKSSMILICLGLLRMPPPVLAQSPNSAESNELIKALLARVEQLEKRVAELEGRPAPSPAPAPEPPEAVAQPQPAVAPSQPEAPPSQPEPAPQIHIGHPDEQGSAPLSHIAGFSDLNFSTTDRRGTHSGFNEGQFVLHLNSRLSSKVVFFGELSFSARTDAGTG